MIRGCRARRTDYPGGVILGVDTSLGSAVGLIGRDGRTLAEVAQAGHLGHAEAIGSLLEQVIDDARAGGARRVQLATATADIGNLRFYQRCGFRLGRVVHDAFGPHSGYPAGTASDGIAVRDQVWFERVL